MEFLGVFSTKCLKDAREMTLGIQEHIVLFTKSSTVTRYDGCEVEKTLLCTYFGGFVR